MKRADGLTKDDSELIGFVTASLFCSAITLEELKAWCVLMIRRLDPDELPAYMFDLCEHNDTMAKIFRAIGFVPSQCADNVERALCGIAANRGHELGDWPVSKEDAIASLRLQPDVWRQFREVFPFIKI